MVIIEIENPFSGMLDIAEKGVKPEKVFERYSLEPFAKVLEHLKSSTNNFVVGRTGVGKTMILSLFDPLYQKTIFNLTYLDEKNPHYSERKQLMEKIPHKIISIYQNIDDPYLILHRFHGKLLNREDWLASFGDYFGHILLRNLIITIEELFPNEKWREHNHIKNIEKNVLDDVAIEYFKDMKAKVKYKEDINNWEDLKKNIYDRITQWERSVSLIGQKVFSGPKSTVNLIIPVLTLKNKLLDEDIIQNDCRFFIIIDQYETLYDLREVIDFRPVFNLAMRESHRGKTQIEFKIGVRPYGYRDNLKVLNSEVKLDVIKECIEIHLDDLVTSYYGEFINDLTNKCLSHSKMYKNFIDKFNELFENVNDFNQISYYIPKTKLKDYTKHFARFFQNFKNREKIIDIIIDTTKEIKEVYKRIWIQTVLAILTQRELKKNKSNTEIGIIVNEKLKYIKEKITVSGFRARFETAYFIIASSYNKIIYSGYETIRLASSNIVLNYIEMVTEIFRLFSLSNPKSISPIPARIQSKAIIKRSTRIIDNLDNRLPHGIRVKFFLLNLGTLFRFFQLDPLSPISTPNGFSLKNRINFISGLSDQTKMIINETLSYGFLEEKEHADVSYKDSRRWRYDLNRILCPYFNISIRRADQPKLLKDPHIVLKQLISIENRKIRHLKKNFFKGNDKDMFKKIDVFLDKK